MKKLNLLTLSLLVSSAITSVAQAQTIDYGMMESIFNEPVTASATGKPQRASDAPVSMSIIGSEEIRRSGAKDIPQILRRIAGVQVQSAFNGQKDVSIRGYNKPFANRILVLVNGRQVLSDAFGYTNWNSLSIGMDEIRQIEVVKGPNTSLFGFNAESGVVNIITFSPMADNKSQASVKVGTQEHKEINLTHTARFDKHAVRVSVGERDADGFSRDSMTGYGTAISSVDKEHSNDWVGRRVNVDHEWQINDSSSLRTQIGHNANLTQRLIPFAAHSRSVNDTDFVQLSYALQSDIGLWNANLYNISNDSHAETTDSENDLLVAKVDNLFKVGTNHSIRVAAEYRDNQISGGIIGGEDATFGMSLLAPSVMWDWKVSDAWNITNSVRYDHADYARNADATFGPYTSQDLFDRTIEEFSFNSAIAYKPTATDTFRASVSRGLHIPSLIELGSSTQVATVPFSIGFTGNPGLEAERIMSYELAWDKKLPAYNATFKSAVFMQKAENLIDDQVSIIGGPTFLLTFDNKGDSDTWGVELGLDGVHNDLLRWGANYTYLVTDDQSGSGLLYEDAQASHQLSVLAGFDHKNWEFDTDMHFVSGYRSSLNNSVTTVTSEDIEGYFVVNARAAYNVNDNLNIAIEGYNLVEEHREWTNGGTTTGPNGADTLGRTVLANLTYKF